MNKTWICEVVSNFSLSASVSASVSPLASQKCAFSLICITCKLWYLYIKSGMCFRGHARYKVPNSFENCKKVGHSDFLSPFLYLSVGWQY